MPVARPTESSNCIAMACRNTAPLHATSGKVTRRLEQRADDARDPTAPDHEQRRDRVGLADCTLELGRDRGHVRPHGGALHATVHVPAAVQAFKTLFRRETSSHSPSRKCLPRIDFYCGWTAFETRSRESDRSWSKQMNATGGFSIGGAPKENSCPKHGSACGISP